MYTKSVSRLRVINGKTCRFCDGPIASRGPKRDAAAIYCSVKCRRERQKAIAAVEGRGLLTKTCGNPACGKQFSYYASMRPLAAYCSASCRSTMAGKKNTGRPPSPYSTRSTFNKSARRFFYDRCAICGYDTLPNDVCHIIDRRHGGEDAVENVTMLCPNHHREFDRGLIAVEVIRQTRLAILRPPWSSTPEWIAWTKARAALSNLVRWDPDNEEAIAAAREEIRRVRRVFETAWHDSGQPVNPHTRAPVARDLALAASPTHP